MTTISDGYREQLKTSLGNEGPEKFDKLFQTEKRGKFFSREKYLRLIPTKLTGIATANAYPTPELANTFISDHGLPSLPNFNDFYTAVRTYELGSKLQEINQKRKVQGNTGIMVSLISIAGDIAAFFPADGGITAATLKGTAMAISGGKAAGKFFQQKSKTEAG